jgi:hypothetical protein
MRPKSEWCMELSGGSTLDLQSDPQSYQRLEAQADVMDNGREQQTESVDGPLPTFVQIGPHPFPIEFDSGAIMQLNRQGNGDRFGNTDIAQCCITIDDSRPSHAQKEVLLHELFHAMFWFVNIDMETLAKAEGVDMEEQIIGQLSGIMLQVMQSNPAIVQWLCESCNY